MKRLSMRENVEQEREQSSACMLDPAVLEAVQKLRAGIDVDESFARIEGWLRPRLIGYFRAHYFSPEDADDLVQKTFARVYLGVRQLEREEKFLAWLFVIARNVRFTAVGEQQRERQMVAGGIELAEEIADPRPASWSNDQQLDQQRLEAVRTAIEALPAQQRQCLLLRVRDELPYTEIAAVLRLSVNTVRNHLAEAKKNLRRVLSAEIERAF
jgi:RNA polymerase sigma-70 factor (ECF subfamily)